MADPIMTRHPEYALREGDWYKWRLAYEGGQDFIDEYIRKLSDRESDTELAARKAIAYNPGFAAAAIDDIKNSIFQRTAEVSRKGGSRSYQEAILGKNGGVDYSGSSMGTFIGHEILAELLSMGRVGVLIDNARDLGVTLQDKGDKRPFIEKVIVENIWNWSPAKPVNGYDLLLLRTFVERFDSLGLPEGYDEQYRFYRRTENGIEVVVFDASGNPVDTTTLNLGKIPFVMFEIGKSLMTNVADYQISLLNVESSDIAFIQKANYPFYYEYYDPKVDPEYMKRSTPGDDGTATLARTSKDNEVKVGLTKGRRFPKGIEAPGFINPDPDTLRVSMDKGRQLREDIRLLVNLNLLNINPRRQSAESKDADNKSLESSLSYIGLVLEKGEREIAELWKMFEGDGDDPTIAYPRTYSIKSDSERQSEADKLSELMNRVPSKTYRKAVAKKIATVTLGGEIADSDLEKIHQEVDEAEALLADPNIIISAHTSGLVDDVTASDAIGFDGKKVIPQAKKDRAEKIKLTMEAQGGPENAGAARGAQEFDKGVKSSEEKEGKAGRGAGDNTNLGNK